MQRIGCEKRIVEFRNKKMKLLLVGAKGALGVAIAEKLYQHCQSLTILDNDNNLLKLIPILGRPSNIHYISFGSLTAENFKKNFELFLEPLKPLDGLVFNSGFGGVRPLNLIETHHLEEMMESNFFAFVELTKLLSKKKILSNGSSIVAISSISSIKGLKSKLAYSASKAALDSAVRCLAAELGSKNIRVNSIQKGALTSDYEMDFVKNIKELSNDEILNKQFLGLIDPNDIADMTFYLLSDSAKSITGTSIIIDAGFTVS